MNTTHYLDENYEGDVVDRGADFLADILSLMGYDAEIVTEVVEKTAIFDVLGDGVKDMSPSLDPSVVNALSHVIRRARFAIGSGFRFDVDINGYRMERIHRLEGVARELHDKIEGGLQQIQCFGMDNADRRALHTLLSQDELVATQSKGYGTYRHLEIKNKDLI